MQLEFNLFLLYQQCTLDEINEGKQWYNQAHDFTFDLAMEYNLSHNKVIGFTSCLSPRTEWEVNKRKVKQLLNSGSVGCTGSMKEKIKSIWTTDDSEYIMKILNGNKTKNFFMNIKNHKDSRFVTIDTHAVRAAVLDYNRKLQDVKLSVNQYSNFATVYKNVANKVNLTPAELQAVIWIKIKNSYK